ncbi:MULTISPECIES: ROK family transcriptional regulator [unclassified Sphaerochaeta]|uniref:ROK family transcriptional regulator n=1 Tax=unclassified Sphaerochaeta TaxID=2637943 RepID=UPI0026001011|nr:MULTISPECIES: ROK family protein [unclassified Sphaerochaeta]MDX9825223.1 ROK family protein [Sphaerochaeta sp.]HPE92629.1 ROK family protein [Sphaerochaeta sp.]
MQGNPLRASDLRVHNQNMVLSLIHASRDAGISQSEVVQKTGLKAPTIFRIFTSLEEEGLIVPAQGNAEEIVAKKGRRPVLYVVSKHARYTIGLEFWTAFLSLGVFDFQGERIYSVMHPLSESVQAGQVIDLIVDEIHRILDELSIPKQKIIGVGVAAPGQVDLARKRVRYYPRIEGMKDIALVDELSRRLGLAVMIHNNCSALAFSEYRYGGFDHQGSMFTFLLRTGVNGAFVHDDEIYINSQNQTIECGHIPIDSDGPRCSCGSRGCLQAYLQDLDPNSVELRLALFEGLEEKLQNGDGVAKRTIERAAGYLVIAMKVLTRLLAPKSFLFVGCCETIAQALREHVEHLLSEPDAFCSETPQIFATAYDPLLAQKGASDLVLQEYFR